MILIIIGCINFKRAYDMQRELKSQLADLKRAHENLKEQASYNEKPLEKPLAHEKPVEAESKKQEPEDKNAGFRKVQPGEVVQPGLDIKMNLDTGDTYVREHQANASDAALVPVGEPEEPLDGKKDKIDLDAIKKLRDQVKPVPKLLKQAALRRPRLDHDLEHLRVDSPSLKSDLDKLDSETLGNDACVAIWSSVNLDNLLALLDSKDAEVRAQVGTILFNSLHNLVEACQLAVKHVSLLCSYVRKETDDFTLYKLISTVHAVLQMCREEVLPLLVQESLWLDLGKCKRPLSFEKSAEMLIAVYPKVAESQRQELAVKLASILGSMPKPTARQLMQVVCPEVKESSLLPYCT